MRKNLRIGKWERSFTWPQTQSCFQWFSFDEESLIKMIRISNNIKNSRLKFKNICLNWFLVLMIIKMYFSLKNKIIEVLIIFLE